MQTYELTVTNRTVKPNSADMTLVRTSVGIDQVHVLFDHEEWLGFPVTATFSQEGGSTVSVDLVLSSLSGDWAAEATCVVPYEVIREVGSVRVTFQGTDSEGRHIITAKGSPLSVEEAGDVTLGDVPADAPTVDEWQQAKADAMAVVAQAAGLVETLRGELDEMVASASESLDERLAQGHVPATTETLGEVIVGSGLGVAESGEVYVTEVTGITDEQASQIANLASLAAYCFDTSFDDDGVLEDTAMLRRTKVPVATVSNPGVVMPDGVTIAVGDDGMIGINMSDSLIDQIAERVAERLSS